MPDAKEGSHAPVDDCRCSAMTAPGAAARVAFRSPRSGGPPPGRAAQSRRWPCRLPGWAGWNRAAAAAQAGRPCLRAGRLRQSERLQEVTMHARVLVLPYSHSLRVAMPGRDSAYSLTPSQLQQALDVLARARETFQLKPSSQRLYRFLRLAVHANSSRRGLSFRRSSERRSFRHCWRKRRTEAARSSGSRSARALSTTQSSRVTRRPMIRSVRLIHCPSQNKSRSSWRSSNA